MCFQHVYILICLLYEVSALEIIVTWDKILIEPNILSFFYSMSYISVCPSTSISQFIASSVHKHLFTAACTLFMSETVFFKASFPCNCSKTITPQNLIEFSGRDLFFIVWFINTFLVLMTYNVQWISSIAHTFKLLFISVSYCCFYSSRTFFWQFLFPASQSREFWKLRFCFMITFTK